MAWFWYFLLYSILGCGLEMLFTLVRRGRLESRKCHLGLPVCPVYGLGGLAVAYLVLPYFSHPISIIAASGALATLVEYLFSHYYERVARVRFWDYSQLRFNYGGRICFSFSLAWGVIAWLVVGRLQPLLALYLPQIPLWLGLAAFLLYKADLLLSLHLLRRHGDKSCLFWQKSKLPQALPQPRSFL